MRDSIIILFCFSTLILFQPIPLHAQKDSMAEDFDAYINDHPNNDVEDKMNEAYLEKLEFEKSLHVYYRESLVNRKEAFVWGHTSSVIIFWMVITIVLFGLIFSAIQFYISMLNTRLQIQKNADSEINKGEISSRTKLKISLEGFEVNSSVLGVIILIISLAFFYLYLVYVYPVMESNIENGILPGT